ncbi:hypothetical protein pb186bvf_001805 [Paramecium bursaria]
MNIRILIIQKKLKGISDGLGKTLKIQRRSKYGFESIILDFFEKSDQQISFNTNYTKTKSLSLIPNNQEQLNPQDIIPFYNEIDLILFDNKVSRQCIYSEMKEYENVEQIKNQRILIQKHNSSSILCVMDVQSEQLMVIKKIKTDSLESAIQKLDEYKIHYHMNQKFPESSLKLYTPVQIRKYDQNYQIISCLERAQFNLYEYSRKHQITKEYSYDILFLILQQIINMHSINIAHRDVKPQNIFYVKDKGWLLSDFGESQQYENIDSLYNIRGTMYFLLPFLKQQITKNKMINQNLLVNDIYALVISIIMIQQQQYIPNIQEVIQQEKDLILNHLLNINNLDELVSFYNHKNIFKEKKFNIYSQPIYIQLSLKDDFKNQKCKLSSCIQLYTYYVKKKTNVEIANQLLEIIQCKINSETIMQLNKKIIYQLYNSFFHGFYLKLVEPLQLVKNFDKYNLNQKKFLVALLYQYGFNERTIYYAKKILKQTYNQDIHLLVIKSYQRNLMRESSTSEIVSFSQQLQLDQLNSNCQLDYILAMLNQNELQFEIEIQNSLGIQQNVLKQFKILANQNRPRPLVYYNDNLGNISQNEANIAKIFIIYLQFYFEGRIMYENQNIVSEVLDFMLQMPIQVHGQFIQELTVQYFEPIDKNIKTTLLYDLGEILYLLNNRKLIQQNYKKMNQMMFNPDCYQQVICSQFEITLLKIENQQRFKKQKDITNIIIKLNKLYKQSYNPFIIYIIKFRFQYAIQDDQYIQINNNFLYSRLEALDILLQLRNYKRIIAIIKKYDLLPIKFYQQYISKMQRIQICGSLKSVLKDVFYDYKIFLPKRFLFQQYLNKF